MIRLISILVLLFGGLSAGAQETILTAEAPGAVRVGEQFRLSYIVNARPSSFSPPEISDFYVLSGPNQSTSTSIQIVNGRRTSSYNITYTYYIQATGAGRFTIPPAKVTVESKEYSSRSLEIEVVASEGSEQPSAQPGGSSNSLKPEDVDLSDELFVRILTDKKSIYRGEPLIATIKIYTRVQISGFGESVMPDFAGFWTQEIEAPTQLNLVRENVGGKIYNTGMIRKVILFPQKSGEVTISPFKLEAYVRQQVQRPRSPFDDFFGSSYSNVLKPLESPAVKITVKDLPDGAPAGFTGAVGKLALQAEIDNTEALTNDAITYKVSISGTGNLQLVEAPKINFPPDFESYDPKVQTDVKNTEGGQNGRKTFEYLLIPRHAGNFRIAPVSISYFDPQTRQYRTLTTKEFHLTIGKSDEEETVGVIAGRTKEDLRIIGQDILFIKDEDFRIHRIGKSFYGSTEFILSYIVSLGLFVIILILRRKRIRRMQNIELVRNQRASKEARKRLKEASLYMKKNETEAFYEAILKALVGYLVDKLNIPVSEMSKEKAREDLHKYNIEEILIAEYIDLADICEMARYAPTSVEGQVEDVYSRSIKVIGNIEQNLR
ncbi:MAG TPA: protein BatD [Bacteroides sp.]|nr:protein BatD [Bacteroides sp.]